MTTMKRQAVFLDRDGVLNRSLVRDGMPFAPVCLEDFEMLPGACDAVARLRDAGYLTIVVTNQPDLSSGKQNSETLHAIHDHLREKTGVDDILVCPHLDADGCDCRKPKPGMLHGAARKWDIDLARSMMVGDRWRDIGAGQAAGCATVFIEYGYAEDAPSNPDCVGASLDEVVPFIVKELKRRSGGQ